jgi:hypothetical protein
MDRSQRIGIIAVSTYRSTRKTVAKDPILWIDYAALEADAIGLRSCAMADGRIS